MRQVDNFELAKQQLKLETEGEKRVDAAYQVGRWGADASTGCMGAWVSGCVSWQPGCQETVGAVASLGADLCVHGLPADPWPVVPVPFCLQGLYKQMVELFRGLGLEATPGGGCCSWRCCGLEACKPNAAGFSCCTWSRCWTIAPAGPAGTADPLLSFAFYPCFCPPAELTSCQGPLPPCRRGLPF